MESLVLKFRGSSLDARFMRSSVFTLGGYGMGQVLRLASNLILTRILFPEAFGMMALVSVIMQGLAMFSDVGVSP
jgi:O-antigen/teichoic acid export membrane protein